VRPCFLPVARVQFVSEQTFAALKKNHDSYQGTPSGVPQVPFYRSRLQALDSEIGPSLYRTLNYRPIPTPALVPKKNRAPSPPQHSSSCYKRIWFPFPARLRNPRGTHASEPHPITGGTPMPRPSLLITCIVTRILALSLFLTTAAFAQDAATGALHGTIFDPAGAHIAQASIVAVNSATGVRYSATSDAEGRFVLDLLPPGDYSARAVAQGMSPQVTRRSTSTSAPPPNSSFTSPSPALRKASPSPAVLNLSTPNPAPSPPSSTNAPSAIYPLTAAASPISCCSRPASRKTPAA